MLPLTFDDGTWYVGGSNRSPDYGVLILHVDELAEVTIGELEDLFAQMAGTREPSAEVYLGNADDLDPELVGVSRVGFRFRNDRLEVTVSFGLPWPEEEHDHAFNEQEAGVQALITPLVKRSETAVLDFATAPYGYELGIEHPYLNLGEYPSRIVLAPPASAVTLHELYAIGDNLVQLIDSFLSDLPTRDTVADLIRAGRADLLIGLRESSWLDMKIQEYAPNDTLGPFKMAVEVSAFCNAEDGGIIVIGGATDGGANTNGGEIITAVDGLHQVRKTPRAYLASLRELIFPPPVRLRIEVVELPTGKPLLLVDIPTQPDDQKPFLVRRAVGLRDDKMDSRGFTIAQRLGEDTVYVDAASLHAQIAAGRLLLKRGTIQNNNG
ncbi:ATP-binding protein [Frigoribacterium faeni]|uniref:AlbA family DNA-binding domain-containing protein n=1 Tax=Frigoribacterium faeni TaxID=145483 RepID=UPI001FAC95D8|nr:ATP-binding protein [Frigoribacterium faeni]MCJ0699858.1 ATP-binding protein [Frigoribacterium faeni]